MFGIVTNIIEMLQDWSINRQTNKLLAATPAEPTQADSGFRFSGASKAYYAGCRPELIAVIELAIRYSLVDMRVDRYGGIRDAAMQEDLIRRRVSFTMRSKHRPIWGDRYSWAVDLQAWKNGQVSWDWNDYYLIAMAVDKAATELGYADNIRWGGAWDRTLADFGGKKEAYARAVAEYSARRRALGKRVFIDGPHFEWVQ